MTKRYSLIIKADQERKAKGNFFSQEGKKVTSESLIQILLSLFSKQRTEGEALIPLVESTLYNVSTTKKIRSKISKGERKETTTVYQQALKADARMTL